MQILVKQDDNSIIQGQLDRVLSETTNANGMYLIHSPVPNEKVSLTPSSYVLNPSLLPPSVDINSVVTELFNSLLSEFPAFSNISFNAFVQVSDLDLIDSSATLTSPSDPTVTETPRFQTGRSTSSPTGIYPNTVAVLPNNTTVTPNRPGLLITTDIDIVALSGSPKSTFMVYWKILSLDTSEDILSTAENSPANRQVVETDQDFGEWLFLANGGTSGISINRLQAFTTAAPVSTCRLAFRNQTSSKLFLAAYAVLF